MVTEKQLIGFRERHTFSAIARIFATREELIDERIQMGEELADKLASFSYGGRPIFKRLLFVVPTDKRFGKRLDCGLTVERLNRKFGNSAFVKILEIKNGGPFCDALNGAITNELVNGISHSFIFSTEARKSINLELIKANFAAQIKGAFYSGVAFDELASRVMSGHIMNTWCMLNNYEALSVRGFDPAIAEMPADDIHANWKKVVDEETGEISWYMANGSEEITMIVRLFEKYNRPVTAPIKAFGEGDFRYLPQAHTELMMRHQEKFRTKKIRGESHAISYGYFNPSVLLWHAMLPEYRLDEYMPHDIGQVLLKGKILPDKQEIF